MAARTAAMRLTFRSSRAPIRSFHTAGRVLAGKESSLHDENRAAEIDQHKHEQLREQKQGKGQWKDELASDSESIVKADRGETKNAEATIAELQKESVKAAQEKR